MKNKNNKVMKIKINQKMLLDNKMDKCQMISFNNKT